MRTILYVVTHTSHCRANTGIQRVTRRLLAAWPDRDALAPVIYDHLARKWRAPDRRECELAVFAAGRKPGESRGSSWSWWQRTRGKLARMGLARMEEIPGRHDGFITVELFGRQISASVIDSMKRRVDGPMVAVFHDMIALELPGISPRKTVLFYEEYLEKLLRFDFIAANSAYSREVLVNYWRRKNIISTPDVLAMPLGVDVPALDSPSEASSGHQDAGAVPLILSVGTLEGRKNHVALLCACETLWREGKRFRLRLIGMANTETGAQAVREVGRLQRAGFPLEWRHAASDRELAASYAECRFMVYPSLLEGFGLPVLESLAYHRPCVCSGLNAMTEIVRDGGCLAVGEPTPENLARGIGTLLDDPSSLFARLAREAAARKIRSWPDYAAAFRDLVALRRPVARPEPASASIP
jgi:glycosyltransferase involved in cell wall biosynthesis